MAEAPGISCVFSIHNLIPDLGLLASHIRHDNHRRRQAKRFLTTCALSSRKADCCRQSSHHMILTIQLIVVDARQMVYTASRSWSSFSHSLCNVGLSGETAALVHGRDEVNMHAALCI